MRIAHLTAGTGSFHCGTCLRDHDLVRGLRKLGHETLMAPLYLPFVLDHQEEPAGDAAQSPPVFLGGVNAYLQQISPIFRHTPRWFDQMWDSAPMLRLAGRQAGMTQASSLGNMTLSLLKGEQGKQVK